MFPGFKTAWTDRSDSMRVYYYVDWNRIIKERCSSEDARVGSISLRKKKKGEDRVASKRMKEEIYPEKKR